MIPKMKRITTLLILITALAFVSCAHPQARTQTTQTTTSTGYRK